MTARAVDTIRPLLPFDADGKPDFPTFVACWVCGGIKGYYSFERGDCRDKDLAHAMALVQHGYYIAKWEGDNVANRSIFPTKCVCACAHANTKEEGVGRCLHRWTCADCGASGVYDSSD